METTAVRWTDRPRISPYQGQPYTTKHSPSVDRYRPGVEKVTVFLHQHSPIGQNDQPLSTRAQRTGPIVDP